MSVIFEPDIVTLTEMTPYPYCAAAPTALTGPEVPPAAGLGTVVAGTPEDDALCDPAPAAVVGDFDPPVGLEVEAGTEDVVAEDFEVAPREAPRGPEVLLERNVSTPARPTNVAPITAG